MNDFFISYNRHDKAWAEWIAWTLEAAGYTVVIEAWDFRAGGNFVLEMHRATSQANRTIAVLSANYLNGRFTHPEWAAAFAQDPTGEKHVLVPVRVGACEPAGLLGPIIYVDLMGLAEAEAKDVLLRSLSTDRAKPDEKPYFPGSGTATGDRPKPVFPPSIPSNLPLVSAIFVGRDEELEQLHVQLQTGDAIAISAVSGMGGIGKTELAAQYALQQRDMGTYPGGICWLKAREDLNLQIVLFAQSHLGLTIPEDLELDAQVAYCWRNWQTGMTLLVLDDVQAYSDVAAVAIPQRSQFRVLLTTRLKLQSPVQDFEIRVLSEEKALELLRAIVNQVRDTTDPRLLQEVGDLEKQLCYWLGYLPLGIELVGRYLALEKDLSLAEMLTRLQREGLQQEALVREEHDRGWSSNAERGAAAAFELSWQTLDPAAQRLGELLSLFALAPIPWKLVEATIGELKAPQRSTLRRWRRWLMKVWQWLQHFWRRPTLPQPQTPLQSVAAIEKARSRLQRLHLLERTEEGIYQLHQLLREFFAAKRSQRTDTAEIEQAFRRVVLAEAQRSTEMPARSLLAETTALMPHLQTVLQRSETSGQETDVALDLAWLANLYYAQGRYAEAEPLFLRALAISEQQLGSDHPTVATGLNNLASLYRAQGRDAEAELLFQQALAISEQQLGSDHPDMATMLSNLASLYRGQGRDAEAEPLYLKALTILVNCLGTNHPNTRSVQNNLVALYDAMAADFKLQGRHAQVAAYLEKAITLRSQLLQ